MYTSFTVKCEGCGYRNKPHASPRKGVELVVNGGFNVCRGCGSVFTQIILPTRPLVMTILAGCKSLPAHIMLKDYTGETKSALGVIA